MSNEIKYVYESTNGSISPLPASPLLVPSLLLLGFIAPFYKAKYIQEDTQAPSRPIDAELHEKYRVRWLELRAKRNALMNCSPSRDLPTKEWNELRRLENPPWRLQYEHWSYSAKPNEYFNYTVTPQDLRNCPLLEEEYRYL